MDLQVEVEPFSPAVRSAATLFLGPDDEEPELSPELMRSLVDSAFAYLMP